MWRQFIKHLKIYGLLIKLNAIRQLEYRVNIVLGLLVEIGYLGIKLLYAYIIHDTGVHISGFAPQSLYLFIGTFILMTVFFVAMLQFNIMAFDRQIIEGEFDLILTKPVSAQFLATLKYVETWMVIPNIIVGVSLVSYGWHASDIAFDIVHVGLYVLYALLGIVTMYCIFTLPLLLAFKLHHISAFHSLVWALWDFNNLPHRIFPSPIQIIGTVFLPIFLITNFSPLAVMGQLSIGEMIWGGIAPILLFFLTCWGWKKAIHSYESGGG
ncbi:ABC-2 family transporter protein [Pseudoalteromonas sp. SMS1]|uniref:ABC transporter permease n=1 Tax=Pseudoalteromonas sp. SMS1 TaxID=2908894 RepID=UPI001F35B22F|nr:ABC-2 family transporter protein [Pseudoalteromonas sp. SMS1]MCF2859908.1 ABC-2 family transporter protein [Pseudoalteromonas sp. SMS1]